MADGKRKTPGTADPARHRQPPTIDLTATEIAGEVERPEQPAPQNEAKAESRKAAPPESAQPATAAGNSGSAPERNSPLMPALLAGLGGGAAVAIIAVALWISGVLAPRQDVTAADGALRARLDALDKKLGEVSARPQASPDTAAVNRSIAEIATRIGAIERAVANAAAGTPADAERLAALDGNLKALGVALAGLNRRVDDIAAHALAARDEAVATAKALGELRQTFRETPSPAGRADIERLTKRLDEIEVAAKSASRTTAEANSTGAAVRLALAASALREAVNAGAPFRAELAAAKAAGSDVATTGPLETFAATGVPGDAALAVELRGLITSLAKAAGTDRPPAGGFLEKLQANAGKLVRVRPLDAPEGADAGAVLARIEASAMRNDIAGARAELERLPAPARAVAAPWLKSVAARDAAREAARTLVADATRALAQPQR